MKFTSLSDSEILLYLDTLSSSHDVALKFAHKKFFISLLHYIEDHGVYDESSDSYYVDISVASFSKLFDTSLTTVVQSLRLLSNCNAIQRITSHPKITRTIVNKIIVDSHEKGVQND